MLRTWYKTCLIIGEERLEFELKLDLLQFEYSIVSGVLVQEKLKYRTILVILDKALSVLSIKNFDKNSYQGAIVKLWFDCAVNDQFSFDFSMTLGDFLK